MKHKWYNEIVAWASGAEIEYLADKWRTCDKNPVWSEEIEYRIKPQPKPDVYLYVYFNKDIKQLALDTQIRDDLDNLLIYVGKIKLEQDDE